MTADDRCYVYTIHILSENFNFETVIDTRINMYITYVTWFHLCKHCHWTDWSQSAREREGPGSSFNYAYKMRYVYYYSKEDFMSHKCE
jgi:hypothetical protein